MSRPAKPIATTTGARTKAAIEARTKAETRLKGNGAIKVSGSLTKRQQVIAEAIMEALKDAEILSSLDETVLAMAAFSIDGINKCIEEQNADPECMNDSNFRQKMKRYEETFGVACKELGLSPQARSKLAIASQNKDTTLDAVKAAIGGNVTK